MRFLLSLGKWYLAVQSLCLTPCSKSTSVSHPFRTVIQRQDWRLSSGDGVGCVMYLWARESWRWRFQNFRWHFPGEEAWLPLPVSNSGPFTALAGSGGLFSAEVSVAVRAQSFPARWWVTLPACCPWWMWGLFWLCDTWSSGEQAKMPQVTLGTDVRNTSTCSLHQNVQQCCGGSGVTDSYRDLSQMCFEASLDLICTSVLFLNPFGARLLLTAGQFC